MPLDTTMEKFEANMMGSMKKDNVRIGTLNSQGGNKKKDHIANYFNDQNLDILLIQETHDIKTHFITEIEKNTNTKIFKNSGTNDSRGVIIMVRESDKVQNSKLVARDSDGNLIEVEAIINGITRTIVNVYAPNGAAARKKLFEKLSDVTRDEDNKIFGGDLNQVFDTDLDCIGKSQRSFDTSKPARNVINRIKSENNYCDVLRSLHPRSKSYTFTGIGNYRARLDYIFIHKLHLDSVVRCGVEPCCFSDHDMFWCELSTETQRPRWGAGTWKYNKRILEDKQNLKLIETLWKTHRQEKYLYPNQLAWWDTGKMKVKVKCIALGMEMKAKENEEEEKLKQDLETEIRKEEPSSTRKIKNLKQALKNMMETKIKGAEIRSGADWRNLGEQPTRYFFTLEKEKGEEQQMTSLVNGSGTLLTGKNDVLQYAMEYYEEHFRKTDTDQKHQDILVNSIERFLTETESESMDEFFKLQELEKIIFNSKLNKSPGLDGLTNEFYRQTYHFTGTDLLNTINEVFISGKIPRTMTQGMIKLIFKNKGERSNLKFWRAISLLNTDYKFMTSLISKRFQPVIGKIVANDQACSVPGRFIEDQLIQLQDLQDYTKQFGGKAMVIGLDLQAAFDLLDHDYLQRVLHRMNIGPRICRLIKTIHSNMYSCVSINGAKTKMFRLTRSCRQGDPNAGTQFIIALEPFANLVRKDRYLHPIRIPNQPPKSMSLYADDTNIICTKPNDYNRVMTLTKIFESGAGAKVNTSKTEILLMGNWDRNDIAMLPQECIRRNIKVLGVWYGPEAESLNRDHILGKIDATIERWKKFNLSYQGKVLIINTKILSVAYHIIRVTGMDRTLEKELQKRLNDFLRHPRKMTMVAYSVLQNTWDAGGIEAPNLRNVSRAILLERVAKIAKQDRPWSGQLFFRIGQTIRKSLNKAGSKLILHTKRQTKISKEILSAYKQLEKEVTEWAKEDFKTLKKRLHNNSEPKRRTDRNYDNTWRQIHKLKNDRKRRDLCYLTAHMSLPVKAVLNHRNVKIDNIHCSFCGEKDETIKHLFIDCRLIQSLKKWIENKLQIRTLGEEEILFHEGRLKMRQKMNEMVAAYKHSIWITRGKLYHGEIKTEKEIQETMKYLMINTINK